MVRQVPKVVVSREVISVDYLDAVHVCFRDRPSSFTVSMDSHSYPDEFISHYHLVQVSFINLLGPNSLSFAFPAATHK
jgi:hypothetical protein